MKMYDIVSFCSNIDREFTYLNRLVCVGPVGVPKKVFFAVEAGNVTTGYSRIVLLVLIQLRHKKAWPEVIKLFHV